MDIRIVNVLRQFIRVFTKFLVSDNSLQARMCVNDSILGF
jgi:hypothetical protein